LHKWAQHLTTGLQQRMAHHNLEEPLQSFSSMLDYIVRKTVREDFAWQRWYCHSCRLSLENVAEVLEIAIASADYAVAEFESWDICARVDLVGCVHVARRRAVRLRVLDLFQPTLAYVRRGLGDPQHVSCDQSGRGKRALTSISRKFSGGP
jgi:hypothetical protein